MKMKLALTLLVFLGLCSIPALSQDDLEKDLTDSLNGLTQLSKDIDPRSVKSSSDNSSASKDNTGVLSQDVGLIDRMILKIKKKFEEELKSNPFRRMSGAEVETLLLEKTQGTFIGSSLKESPRIMYFLVNFVRDEFAMSDMFQIFKKDKELKMYSYFVIGNIIFFFFLGLYYDRKSRNGFIIALFRKMFFFLLSTAISLAVFYVIFHKELKSTVSIAQEAVTKAI